MNEKVLEKIEKHALMVNEIVHYYLTSIKESPDEYDTLKLISNIGKDCFIRGYAEGLSERAESEN
jgi:hypothetical protein